jgi:hypothetical protein
MGILKGKVAVVRLDKRDRFGVRAGIRRCWRQHRAQRDWGAGRCRKNANCNRERFRFEGYLFAREYGRANGSRQHDLVCREDV